MWILTWLCPCNIHIFKWPQNHKYICLYHATAISRDHYEHKILYYYIYISEIYCIWATVIDFKKDMSDELKYTCFHYKNSPIFLLAAFTVLRDVSCLCRFKGIEEYHHLRKCYCALLQYIYISNSPRKEKSQVMRKLGSSRYRTIVWFCAGCDEGMWIWDLAFPFLQYRFPPNDKLLYIHLCLTCKKAQLSQFITILDVFKG